MNDLSQLDSGAWASPDFFFCPCRGGWLLSSHDSWHRCPYHAEGDRHPEDEDEYTEAEKAAVEGYAGRMARQTFKHYDRQARALGIVGYKNQVAWRALDILIDDFGYEYDGTDKPSKHDAEAFCKAAADVVAAAQATADDSVARAHGYSCSFEMRMANEAMWERKMHDDENF